MKKRTPLLTAEQQRSERLISMARTFERADSTLAGRRITVSVDDNGSVKAPGYSVGDRIFLNSPYIGDITTTDDIIKVTGINFHELAHAQFTPWDCSLTKRIQSCDYMRAFNILEDQRIESLMSAQYPSLRAYFTMTVMAYIAGDKGDPTTAHVLTYGRRFLPKRVRKALRKNFAYPDKLKEIESIIDQYRRLVLPSSPTAEDECFALVEEFHWLLNKMNQSAMGSDPYGHGDCPNQHAPSQEPKSHVRDAKVQAQAEAQEALAQDDKSGSQALPDDTDANESGGAGSDEQNALPEGDDLKDLADQIAKSLAASSEVQQDAQNKKASISAGAGSVPQVPQHMHIETPIDSDSILASSRFKRELMKLWADSDPGYHTHKASGRVNIPRAMRGDDFDVVFDEWNPGKLDATDLEVVLLVDHSSSMRRVMGDVSRAVWVIKSALQAIDADVTVIGFGDCAATYYTRKQKVNKKTFRNFSATGGTQPWDALLEARKIMHYSKRAHRAVIFLTDGAWSSVDTSRQKRPYSNNIPAPDGTPDHEAVIQQFHAHGISTALAYLGNMSESDLMDYQIESLTHGVQTYRFINEPKDLVDLARVLVKQMMKS